MLRQLRHCFAEHRRRTDSAGVTNPRHCFAVVGVLNFRAYEVVFDGAPGPNRASFFLGFMAAPRSRRRCAGTPAKSGTCAERCERRPLPSPRLRSTLVGSAWCGSAPVLRFCALRVRERLSHLFSCRKIFGIPPNLGRLIIFWRTRGG